MSPNDSTLSRRQILGASAVLAGSILPGAAAPSPTPAMTEKKFRYSLNMSTIRGQELSLTEDVDIAGKAGYDAIEPWFRKINPWVEAGGKLADLRKRIEDNGLTVESSIGFGKWIVDDDAERAKGLEECKRDMDTIAQLGGKRIAAPPAGASGPMDLDVMAERYRALLDLSDTMGIIPQIEMWGPSPAIGTIEKAIYIAVRSGHPKACFLGDVYHNYKGGCSFEGFKLLGPGALQNFHMNDYPANPPRETIKDEHRVYPGDGIGPVVEVLKTFIDIGAYPVLSLELFNPTYWAQPALEVAKTGLEKMKTCVAKAQAS